MVVTKCHKDGSVATFKELAAGYGQPGTATVFERRAIDDALTGNGPKVFGVVQDTSKKPWQERAKTADFNGQAAGLKEKKTAEREPIQEQHELLEAEQAPAKPNEKNGTIGRIGEAPKEIAVDKAMKTTEPNSTKSITTHAHQAINLALNENQYGLAPAIKKELGNAFCQMATAYNMHSPLKERLAVLHNVPPERIVLFNGAEDALRSVFFRLASFSDSKTVLLADPTWAYYAELAKQCGLKISTYDLAKKPNEYYFDAEDIFLKLGSARVAAILINTPNNPTGNTISQDGLSRVYSKLKRNEVMIIDETCAGFDRTQECPKLEYNAFPRAIFIRSFSKTYALAGLRVGYAIVGPEANEITHMAQSYLGFNGIADHIACMSLDNHEHYRKTSKRLAKERQHVYNFFAACRGFTPYKSSANFILVELGAPYSANDYAAFLNDRGVKIKTFTAKNLQNHVRITIGTPKQMNMVMGLTRQYAKQNVTKRVLLMGGTGFVGSAVAEELVRAGHHVDVFTRGNRPLEVSGIRTHLKGDRDNLADLKRLLNGKAYDCICDVTAQTPEQITSLFAALDKKPEHYVFCSSEAVYYKSEGYKSEEHPRGNNLDWGEYGISKKRAEDVLLRLHRQQDLPVTIFRPSYVYGPGNNLHRENYFFERLKRGQPIPVPGDGNTKLQVIYITDLAKIFASSVTSNATGAQVLNLTHPKAITWNEFIRAAAAVVGAKPHIVHTDLEACKREGIVPRDFFPFRDSTFLTDTRRLRTSHLPKPATSLRHGLKKAYKAYSLKKPKTKDGKMTKISLVLRMYRLPDDA